MGAYLEIEGLEGAILRRRDLEQTCQKKIRIRYILWEKAEPVAGSTVPPVALA